MKGVVNPGNATTTVTVSIGGAMAILVVFILQKIGVDISSAEASTLTAALTSIFGWCFGARK